MDNFVYLLGFGSGTSGALLSQFIRIILATIFVAGLAYFATKLLALSRGRAAITRGGNLKVIESIAIGMQSVLQLVKAGDKYLVLGITKERITLLAELSAEEVTEPEPPDFGAVSVPFNKVLQKFLPKATDGQRDEDLNE